MGYVRCLPCISDVKVGNMGASAIFSHSKAGAHRDNMNRICRGEVEKPRGQRDFWGMSDSVLRAEIYLLLAGLDARISYSAIDTMCKILPKIDKDSQILKGISLNRWKVSHYVGFGLG